MISWIASGGRSAATTWPPRHARGRRGVGRIRFGGAGAPAARARRSRRAALVGLAHFNHQLRAAADRDEAFCVELAESLGVRSSSIARTSARSPPRAPLDRRRRARRRATRFSSARACSSARTSSRSATRATIRPRRFCCACCAAPAREASGPCTRAAARSSVRCSIAGAPSCGRICGARDIPFVHDETNADVSIPRNRVRAELLPLLEQRFNPAIVDVLADEAELAREEYALSASAADERDRPQCRATAERWTLDVPALWPRCRWRCGGCSCAGRCPRPRGGRPVRFADVERRSIWRARRRRAFDAPGQRVERIGADVVLTGRPPERPAGRSRARPANFFRYPLSIPGEVHVAEADASLSAEVVGPLRTGCSFGQGMEWPSSGSMSTRGLCGQKSASGRPVPAAWARPAQETAGLFRGPEGRREQRATRCRSSSTSAIGSCGWPGTRSTRSFV